MSTEKFGFRKIAACSEKLNCSTAMGHGFQSTTCMQLNQKLYETQ